MLTADLILLDAEGNEVPSDYITMSSDTASVTVPLLKTKRLPITVDFLNVPEDFPLDELRYTLSKEDLLVAGPESSINSMTELSVGYIDFRDLDGGEYNFNLNLPAGFINLEGDESITVSIDTTGIISRTMSVSEIRLENVPDGYTVTPVTTAIRDVTVYGRSDIMETLTEEDLVAVVDLSDMDLSEGTSSAIANLSAPGKGLVWCSGTYRVQFSVQSTD